MDLSAILGITYSETFLVKTELNLVNGGPCRVVTDRHTYTVYTNNRLFHLNKQNGLSSACQNDWSYIRTLRSLTLTQDIKTNTCRTN